jgi:hypothetical protein
MQPEDMNNQSQGQYGTTFNERRAVEYITRNEFKGFGTWMERLDKDLEVHRIEESKTSARLEQIERDISEIKASVKTMTDAWTQTQGAAKLARLLFFVIGPLVLAGYWIKDHLK